MHSPRAEADMTAVRCHACIVTVLQSLPQRSTCAHSQMLSLTLACIAV